MLCLVGVKKQRSKKKKKIVWLKRKMSGYKIVLVKIYPHVSPKKIIIIIKNNNSL